MCTEDNAAPDIRKAEVARLLSIAAYQGEADTYSGKRGATRVAEGLLLEVRIGPRHTDDTWDVRMHDISDSGLSFWSKQNLHLDQSIFVREFSPDHPCLWLEATVKHRTKSLTGHLIGAHFDFAAETYVPPWE